MYFFVDKENYCQISTCPALYCFNLFVCAQFCNEIARWQLQKSLKYFSAFRPIKIVVQCWIVVPCPIFEYVPWKNVWHCFISILGGHSNKTLNNCAFESHGKPFSFFFLIKKIYQVLLCPVKQCLIWFKLRFLSRSWQ